MEKIKVEKGLKCRIEDKEFLYFGYVSRIYKTKLHFKITWSNNKMMLEGSICTLEIDVFEDVINNKKKDIKCESYIEDGK